MKKNTFLELSAGRYHKQIVKGWEKLYLKKREYLYKKLRDFFVPGKALELGSADGIMTEKIRKDFKSVTVVDGSLVFLEQLKKNVNTSNVILIHSLFERFKTKEKFDGIFMTHILEHLDNPTVILKNAARWLSPNGRIFLSVPNANSLHRLIGVKMGLLETVDELNPQDKILGHKRVYTAKLLKSQIKTSGLKIVHFGGIMIKPLSNRQIEQQWSNELIDAFFSLGDDMPELCSEIYAVLKL